MTSEPYYILLRVTIHLLYCCLIMIAILCICSLTYFRGVPSKMASQQLPKSGNNIEIEEEEEGLLIFVVSISRY